MANVRIPPLTTAQAAKYLGVSVATLRRWSNEDIGPREIRYSDRVRRYEVYELEQFKRRHERA